MQEYNIKPKTFLCSRCRKSILENESYWISNYRFCKNCIPNSKKGTGNSGKMPEIHLDSEYVQRLSRLLRIRVKKEVVENCSTEVRLAMLEDDAVGKCFPDTLHKWERAFFVLDLKDAKISATLATKSKVFDQNCSEKIVLSVSDFHRIANEFNFDDELKIIQTAEDIRKLIITPLKRIIEDIELQNIKKMQEIKGKIRYYNNMMPKGIKEQEPTMEIVRLVIILSQRFGSSSVKVYQSNGIYKIEKSHVSYSRESSEGYNRSCCINISSVGACWLEYLVKKVMMNNDTSVWSSVYGCDFIKVEIETTEGIHISEQCMDPPVKYMDLKNMINDIYEYEKCLKEEI